MVNKVWLIKNPGDFPDMELIEEDDVFILIQNGVLKIPYFDNYLVCRADAEARNIKIEEDKLITYEDIIDLIEKADKVILW
jgi:tRNA 2-thiouridine synthesizing protein B